MKMKLIAFLTILGIGNSAPLCSAQMRPGITAIPAYKPEGAVAYVPLMQRLNQLPYELKEQLFRRVNWSDLELLKFYDFLYDLREEIPVNTANKKFKDTFIDDYGNYIGESLMGAIQQVAMERVGKVLGCSNAEMAQGTCQPLKNSTDPEITPEQKATMPFKEFNEKKEPWPRDWIHLLPAVNIFNNNGLVMYLYFRNQYPLIEPRLWKINFLKKMYRDIKEDLLIYKQNDGTVIILITDGLSTYLNNHFSQNLIDAIKTHLHEPVIINFYNKNYYANINFLLKDNLFIEYQESILFKKIKDLHHPNIMYLKDGNFINLSNDTAWRSLWKPWAWARKTISETQEMDNPAPKTSRISWAKSLIPGAFAFWG